MNMALNSTTPTRPRKAALEAASSKEPTSSTQSLTVTLNNVFRFLDLPPEIRNRIYYFCVNKTPIDSSNEPRFVAGPREEVLARLRSILVHCEDEEQRLFAAVDQRLILRPVFLGNNINFSSTSPVFMGLMQTCRQVPTEYRPIFHALTRSI